MQLEVFTVFKVFRKSSYSVDMHLNDKRLSDERPSDKRPSDKRLSVNHPKDMRQ